MVDKKKPAKTGKRPKAAPVPPDRDPSPVPGDPDYADGAKIVRVVKEIDGIFAREGCSDMEAAAVTGIMINLSAANSTMNAFSDAYEFHKPKKDGE